MAEQWNIISAFVLDQLLGYQTMNKVRGNMIALASLRIGARDLGGSKYRGQRVTSYTEVPDSRHPTIDGTNAAGFTAIARVERFTENAATSVQARVQNLTAATTAGTGTSSTSTTPAEETFAVTIATGANRYELQHIGGNANADIFSNGVIEIYATA